MSTFQRAVKKQARARVALEGPTGSGKTWNGLVWATALGERIAVVDTERSSASLYAPHFTFDVVEFGPPYEPAKLVEIIKVAEAEGYDVLMIDSLSHFWEGEGGTLDMVDAAAQRARGNSYAGWKVGTPALRHLVDTMLNAPLHLVVTMRSKMEYVLQTDERGRQVPQKVGMAPVMRAGVEYEFTLVGDLDLEHRLTVSKSRCDVLADLVAPKDRIREAAVKFAAWLQDGEAVKPAPHPLTAEQKAELAALDAALPPDLQLSVEEKKALAAEGFEAVKEVLLAREQQANEARAAIANPQPFLLPDTAEATG